MNQFAQPLSVAAVSLLGMLGAPSLAQTPLTYPLLCHLGQFAIDIKVD